MGKVGIPGIICMSLKKNTKGVLSNWRVVKCPKCGRECYERPIPKGYEGLAFEKALCTECAFEGERKKQKLNQDGRTADTVREERLFITKKA